MGEKFRVLRHDADTLAYVGTFEGDNAKEAIRQAVFADAASGEQRYEAHVLRNASLYETKARNEKFLDSVVQQNTYVELLDG